MLQSENDSGTTSVNLLARHLVNEFYFAMDDVADAAAAGDKNAAKARHSPPATCHLLPCAPTTYHYLPPTYSNPNPNPNQGGVDQGPGLRQRLLGHRQPRHQRQGGRQVRADRGQHLSMESESLG